MLKAASDKYQERQDQRRMVDDTASSSSRYAVVESEKPTDDDRLAGKFTMQPPSYEAVMSNNEAQPSTEAAASGLEGFGEKQKAFQGTPESLTGGEHYRSWWQQKKAENAARKAEKWAEKARSRGYVY